MDNQLFVNRLSMQIEVCSRAQTGAIECVANNSIGELAVAGLNLHAQCELTRKLDISSQLYVNRL